MINKKGSTTLIFVVISILIISSGLVAMHEFQKPHEQNVAGTELVLLKDNQDSLSTLSFLDNEDDDDFETLFLSSSGGNNKGSKKKSKKSDNPDVISEETNSSENLDIINNENETNNETENKTDLSEGVNETENNTLTTDENSSQSYGDNESNLNDSFNETENKTDLSEGDLNNSSENVSDEEVAENTLKSLKSIVNPSVIWFTKAPPSDICYNLDEVVETISLGLGTVNLKWGILNPDYYSCSLNGQKDISVKYCLIEDDPLYDDVIKCEYATATTYDCETLNLENFRGYIVKREFTNIKLSGQFDEFGEGDTIGVYAEVSNYNNYFDYYKTSTYDIDKVNCDCLSGSCCDLSSRPYKFKSSGSQPTGKTDYYGCWDLPNSPIGISYVYKIDYYCNGNDANSHYSDSTKDTCGTCEYCTSGDSTCNYYGTSTSCGTKDCDYLESSYPCRDYHDVNKYCNSGSCISPSCNDYSNRPKGTSCGSGKECNAYGTCITCTSHSYTKCYNNDVYYFDKCDNREEKKWECGSDSCGSWLNFCKNNDAYRKRTCHSKGCLNDACYSESYVKEEKVQDCGTIGCSSGKCNFACSEKSDCGTNKWIGSPYCKVNYKDLYQIYRYYKCNNPGTIQSSCTYTDEEAKKEICQYGCENGKCKPEPGVECSENLDCGVDGWTGSPFCFLKGVWQSYTNYYCRNPGTTSSYCESSYMNMPKEECGVDEYSDNYCYDDDVYRDFTDRGCSSGSCFEKPLVKQKVKECGDVGCTNGICNEVIICWSNSDCGTDGYTGYLFCQDNHVWQNYIEYTCNNPGTAEASCSDLITSQLKEDCPGGCIDGRCKVEVCKEVCTWGKCYEYCKWE